MSNYETLLERDNTNREDTERKSLFYILGNNEDLFRKVNHIYDFKNHLILPNCLENGKVDFCSSSKKLIRLAFNLFNGYSEANVLDVFSSLEEENFEIALNSIRIRFNKL